MSTSHTSSLSVLFFIDSQMNKRVAIIILIIYIAIIYIIFFYYLFALSISLALEAFQCVQYFNHIGHHILVVNLKNPKEKKHQKLTI